MFNIDPAKKDCLSHTGPNRSYNFEKSLFALFILSLHSLTLENSSPKWRTSGHAREANLSPSADSRFGKAKSDFQFKPQFRNLRLGTPSLD